MDEREKLIEMIQVSSNCPQQADWISECGDCQWFKDEDCSSARIADHLLAHGVTVREPGRWTKVDASYWSWKPDGPHPVARVKYRHDECGKTVSKPEPFCPNCGAPMKGDTT